MELSLNNRGKKIVGSLRRSQIITTHGPGSIVDFPDESVIIAGTETWENDENIRDRVFEHRLEKLLDVDYFVLPKVNYSKYNTPYPDSRDIASYRFPEMLFCNKDKCSKLRHYSQFNFNKVPECSCGGALVPSRFVVACKNGHLEDFPYSWWVHRGEPDNCDNPDKLKIFHDEETGGLESIIIYCEECQESRSMKYSFSEKALSNYNCQGYKPWCGENSYDQNCEENVRTVQRGASNLFFPIHVSALSIPPWSEKIQKELRNKWGAIESYTDDEELLKRAIVKNLKITEKFNCTFEEVKSEIDKKLRDEEKPVEYSELIEDEYRAFTREEKKGGDFVTEKESPPDFVKNYINQVVKVKKLREVLALCGFSRIEPQYFSSKSRYREDESKTFENIETDYNGDEWVPAIEMNGEGIFIELDREKVKEWENNKKVKNRYKSMNKNLEESFINKENFSPRYVLLHTISHLMIRELILKCGYSSASLKERIYSTYENDDSLNMAGILIYTSTSDSDGSLGGLVKEGRKDRLENTLKNMFDNASWCSSDPVCIQSTAQGIDSLNYAACHSCTLLPETSCEISNTLLDRVVLLGDLDNEISGYFSELIREEL